MVFWLDFMGEMKKGDVLIGDGFMNMSYMRMGSCWSQA